MGADEGDPREASLAMVLQVCNTSVTSISGRRIQEHAQNQVHAQTWHLRQLLPLAGSGAPPA